MNVKSRLQEMRKNLQPTIKEIKFTIKRIKQSPLSILGLAIVIFFACVAIGAPVLAPPPENWRDPFMVPKWPPGTLYREPEPPQPGAPFGTVLGYNIYYACIWGTVTAFWIGIEVVAGILLIGLVIGSISAYYGGLVDEILMRITDIIIAFPGLILAMAIVAVRGPSMESVVIALILTGWPSYARVIRSEILRVKNEDYVEAARAVGCSDFRIITRHILPNSIYTIIIMASLDIGAIVLSAAALSFLGLGAPSGYADWGQFISFSRDYIYKSPQDPLGYWWTWTIPGIFIFTFVLGWNLLGDAFRDILDPTIRRR